MAQTAVLVPVPFHAPVPTGTEPFFDRDPRTRRGVAIRRVVRTAPGKAVECPSYRPSGQAVDARRVGRLVDLYA